MFASNARGYADYGTPHFEKRMQSIVVHLSGPRNVQDHKGRHIGKADISRVRLRRAMYEARERDCVLYSPIKASEQHAHARDLLVVADKLACDPRIAKSESGAAHTLANAWMSLRYAYRVGCPLIVVATSEWHRERAEIAFRGIADVAHRVMGQHVALEFVDAPMSRSRSVQRFEREIMERAERDWKRSQEAERVREYARRVARVSEDGFLPNPDALCPFEGCVDKTYQSRSEPQAVRAQQVLLAVG